MTNALLFEGRDLEEVLSEAQLVFGADVEIVAANRVRKGGVLGFFAREWYEVWAHGPENLANPALTLLERTDDEFELDSFQSMVTNAIAAQTPGDGFDSAMARFFGDEERRQAATAATSGGPAIPSAGPDIVAEPTGGGVAVAERPVVTSTIDPITEPEPAMPSVSAAVALEDPPRGASVFDEPRTPRTDLLWAVLDRIESMAAVTALPTEGIVVFIGDAAVALPAVQELGRRLGAWNNEVAVVTRRHIEDVPTWLAIDDLVDLGARAPRWRRREGVVPVIIDDTIDKPNLEWIGEALDALAPTQTRLVTEAWRLPEQVGRIALRLGGVDAIELTQASETIDPLAMLDLDIPIGSVEGRPATPELLAAVWLDRRRRG